MGDTTLTTMGTGVISTASGTAGSRTRATLGCHTEMAIGCGSTITAGTGLAMSRGDGLPTIGAVGIGTRPTAGAGSRVLPACDTLGDPHWLRSSGTQPSRPAGSSRGRYMAVSAGHRLPPASASSPGTDSGTTREIARPCSITESSLSTTIATPGTSRAYRTSIRAIWAAVRGKRPARSAQVRSSRPRRSGDRCPLFRTVPAKGELSSLRDRIAPELCRTP